MFESHAPNLENLQNYLSNEQSKRNESGDGVTWWSLPSGMSSIRILPPWDPTGRIALAVNMHPIEYQNKDMKYKKYNWTCSSKTFDKPCKICEGLEQLAAAGVDVSKWEANRRQFYMNVIVMYDPRYDADIKAGKKPEEASGVAPGTHVVMRTPKTIYDWVISQITNTMVGDITSITNGIDVYVTKEGSGLGTKYTPTLSPNGRTAVPQEYLDKIEALYNLDEIFSKGFDDDLINELVDHLKKSAGVVANDMPGVVSQMAGYQPSAGNGYMNPVPPMQGTNVQPAMTPNQFTAPTTQQFTAPNPYANTTPIPSIPVPSMPVPTPAPQQPAVPPAPMNVPAQNTENLPKCFGQYNPQQVNCVVCNHEVECSQIRR